MLIIKDCHGCGKPTRGGKGRCIGCRILRRAADREQKRELAEALFSLTLRTKLLALLRAGVPLGEACAEIQVSTAQVYGYRAYDPAWSVRLDSALMEGRDPSLLHGQEMAYRWHKCRCPECRAWKQQSRAWSP